MVVIVTPSGECVYTKLFLCGFLLSHKVKPDPKKNEQHLLTSTEIHFQIHLFPDSKSKTAYVEAICGKKPVWDY